MHLVRLDCRLCLSSCICRGILVLHSQKGNCCLKARPLWPVSPDRTTLIGYAHVYRLLCKDKSFTVFTYLLMELKGINIISTLWQLYIVIWYDVGSNPSHLEGLGRAGSSGKGEEECSANSGVHSCLQV